MSSLISPDPLIKYFRVDLAKSKALNGCYDLTIFRLMKERESLANGLGPNQSWNQVGLLRCVDERNAMCIVSMLERPREPLQNNEEELLWAEKLAGLEKHAGA